MKCYVVDAFTNEIFKGNPAAVCVLNSWLSDEIMQEIAGENNLSETAFTVKNGDYYKLRWFTPGGEIDLCGHATLATAYVLMNFIDVTLNTVSFQTKSGVLVVKKQQDLYEIEMPAYKLNPVPITQEMITAIGFTPTEAWMGRDLVCVLENEEQVINATPNETMVKKLDGLLLHLTAKGKNYDCVTRTFAPKLNVTEDPVCGSGHCHVIPLWANKLDKLNLRAYQASKRSGTLYCQLEDNKVFIAGNAVLYSKNTLFLPNNHK